MNTADPSRAATLRRRVRLIVTLTIGYNAIEAVIALSAGAFASSSALIGFGLDSVVEVGSAAAVAWQFAAPDPRRREHVTLRMIAVAFFALALLVSVDAVVSLVRSDAPEHSIVGIVLAAVSLVVMPAAARFETRTGRELGSATAVADARQLIVCSYLSAALLVGLTLNATLGWWWADPVAALVIAGFAVREGIEAWHGDTCGATTGALLMGQEQTCEGGDDCDDCADGPTESAAHIGVAQPHPARIIGRPPEEL